MSYQFTDRGLTDAIERFQKSQAADELAIAMAFLERLVNSLQTEEDLVASAETVLAFTTKISTLRQQFQKMLQENKVWYHRDSLPQAMSIIADGVWQVIKPLDPSGLLMDQIVAHVQESFNRATEEIDK